MNTSIQEINDLQSALEHAYINKNVIGDYTHAPVLITNNPNNDFDAHFREELKNCNKFSISVAFISPVTLRNYRQLLIESDKEGIIYTSTMNYFNKPEVFYELDKIQEVTNGRITCKVFSEEQRNYHPKGYHFEHQDYETIIIGSSNFTDSALNSNYEWNIKFSSYRNGDIVYRVQNEFEYQDQHSEPITIEWIKKYEEKYKEFSPQTTKQIAKKGHLQPNLMQVEALENLARLREDSQTKALLISATGTGKTILSALDVKQFMQNHENANILFVAHSNTILRQAKSSFKLVLGGVKSDFGLVGGGKNENNRKYVFANINSLRDKDENYFNKFNYVIIDETHKSGANSYQDLLQKIAPEFLLGMTATPERTDGFDIFKDFDYNIAYEIRLRSALDNKLLCPFHYYGVADLEVIDKNSRNIEVLTCVERINNIINSINKYKQAGVKTKGLVFCSTVDEAQKLSELFNERKYETGQKYKTASLTGVNSEQEREQAVDDLVNGELDLIFTRDIFNEGADIPDVNLVVMLRETQSSIIFTQQLGRGLRKKSGKEDLVVIDFIGNYDNNYLIPIALFGKTPPQNSEIRRQITNMERPINNGGYSSVYFDKIAKERVLKSIESAKLSNKQYIKASYKTLKDRLNRKPMLYDFYKTDFIDLDPRLIASSFSSLLELEQYLDIQHDDFTDDMKKMLTFLTQEFTDGKRKIECEILAEIMKNGRWVISDNVSLRNVLKILNKQFYTDAERKKYGEFQIITEGATDTELIFTSQIKEFLQNEDFKKYFEDVLKVALAINEDEYEGGNELVIGKTYIRKDVCRILNWDNNNSSTMYGYSTKHGTTPMFVNMHKAENTNAALKYEDAFLSKSEFLWYSRANRTTMSQEILNLIDTQQNKPHLFVQKHDDNKENSFYYLGTPEIAEHIDTRKTNDENKEVNVVKMKFRFKEEFPEDIYNYLTDDGENLGTMD